MVKKQIIVKVTILGLVLAAGGFIYCHFIKKQCDFDVKDIKVFKKNPEKRDEWIYYSMADGIYRVTGEGKDKKKLYAFGEDSFWDYVQAQGQTEEAIYFTYQNRLYKGDIEGVKSECISEEIDNAYRITMDEITKKKWLIYTEKGFEITHAIDLETMQDIKLSRRGIGNLFIYNDEFIYDTPVFMLEGMNALSIYSCDQKGNEKVLIHADDYLKDKNKGVLQDVQDIKSCITDVRQGHVYFHIADYMRSYVELFDLEIALGRVKSILSFGDTQACYIGAKANEHYIEVSHEATSQDGISVLLDKETYQQKAKGEVIGSDENGIYLENGGAIYHLNPHTGSTTKLAEAFPMDWEQDNKSNHDVKIGKWIYFMDYENHPTDVSSELRKQMPALLYRVNVDTGDRELVKNDLLKQIDFYEFEMRKMHPWDKEDEDRNYVISTSEDGMSQIVKLKKDTATILVSENNTISKIQMDS